MKKLPYGEDLVGFTGVSSAPSTVLERQMITESTLLSVFTVNHHLTAATSLHLQQSSKKALYINKDLSNPTASRKRQKISSHLIFSKRRQQVL